MEVWREALEQQGCSKWLVSRVDGDDDGWLKDGWTGGRQVAMCVEWKGSELLRLCYAELD